MESRETLLALENRKQDIEEQLKTHIEILEAPGMPGLTGSLIDAEGFPRADIDVYAVRQSRHKIVCLKNDYKQLQEEIDRRLQQLHSTTRVSVAREKTPRHTIPPPPPVKTYHQKAFALVDDVCVGSPAAESGLKVGDGILAFGSVVMSEAATNVSQCFDDIPQCVEEEKEVKICILRGASILELLLVPRKWAGQGLLGCHLQPI